MRVFIVHAHLEPRGFNGAMTRAAAAALKEAGHDLAVSDLYAMGFDPVSDRHNFTTVTDPDTTASRPRRPMRPSAMDSRPSCKARWTSCSGATR